MPRTQAMAAAAAFAGCVGMPVMVRMPTAARMAVRVGGIGRFAIDQVDIGRIGTERVEDRILDTLRGQGGLRRFKHGQQVPRNQVQVSGKGALGRPDERDRVAYLGRKRRPQRFRRVRAR